MHHFIFTGPATSVSSEWTNGTNSEASPSKIAVDSQIRFSEVGTGCAGANTANPAQFEAHYNVKVRTGGATPVKIER